MEIAFTKFRLRFIVFMVILQLMLQGVSFSLPLSQVKAEGYESLTEVPTGYIGIYSAEDFNKIRNNLSGKFIIMNDIHLTEESWEPIGAAASPFTGVFDGNGYSVIGMNVNVVTEGVVFAGLFGYGKNAQIKNVTMKDNIVYGESTSVSSSTATVHAGSVLGYGYDVTISNITNSGNVTASSLFYGNAGGIVGSINTTYNKTSTIVNCYNDGEINAKSSAGGIIGYGYRLDISQSGNTGGINISSSLSRYAGGIAGDLSYSSISYSHNKGTINMPSGTENGGGITGNLRNSTITSTYNEGMISAKTDSADGGGIAGESSGSTIIKSYNTGGVSTNGYSGGIVGVSYSTSILKSYNTGSMSGNIVAGISAWLSGSNVLDSFNMGDLTGDYDAGGITAIGKSATLKNSYNTGLVTTTSNYSSNDKGGIAAEYEGVIINCFYINRIEKGVEVGSEEGTFSKTMAEMTEAFTFSGFDYTSTWSIDKDTSYKLPMLRDLQFDGVEKNMLLQLVSMPKQRYIQGEELDITGTEATVFTNFGNSTKTSVTQGMISGYDKSKLGPQRVQVSYANLTAVFDVRVVLKAPEVLPISDKHTYVTGTTAPRTTIIIKIGENVLTGKSDAYGRFSIPIKKQMAGTVIDVTAQDSYMSDSDSTAVTVTDDTSPLYISVYSFGDSDTWLTGATAQEATVTVSLGDTQLGTAEVDEMGEFRIPLEKQKAGTQITLYAFDTVGNTSEKTILTVQDYTAPESPKVDPITNTSVKVTGETEPNTTVEVKIGNNVYKATADDSGKYEVAIPVQRANTSIMVSAKDVAGNGSPAVKVIVEKTAPDIPVIYQVTNLQGVVSGRSEAFATVLVTAGGEVYQGSTDDNGFYSISIPVQNAYTTISVVAKDILERTSAPAETTVAWYGPNMPTVNKVDNKKDKVYGQTDSEAIVVVSVSGKVYRTTADESGNYSVAIPIQKAGTTITIRATVYDEYTSAERIITVARVAPNIPTVNGVTNKSDKVTGKTEAKATVIATVSGKSYIATADAYGNYIVKIPVQNAGTAISIIAKDSTGSSAPIKVNVTKVAPNVPIVNTVDNKTAKVSGKTEARVLVTAIIGSKSYSAAADAYGNYTVKIPVQNAGITISVVAKDKSGNSSAAKVVKVTKIAPNMPTVNTVDNKAGKVTGKTEASATVTVTVNKKTYSAKASTSGSYTVTIPVPNAGTVLSVTAKDKAGKVSAAKSVTVTRVAPNMPTVNTVKSSSTAVTGSTEKYATVMVKIGKKTYTKKASSNSYYKVIIPKQKAGTKLYVSAKDKNGKVSATRTITVIK